MQKTDDGRVSRSGRVLAGDCGERRKLVDQIIVFIRIYMKFIKFKIKNFRSLLNLTLDINDNYPISIAGENNIGKTNLLRALNVYFNHLNEDLFNPELDIPHHIYYGSGGKGLKTELTGTFLDEKGGELKLKITFTKEEVEYHKNDCIVDEKTAKEILDKFYFIFIESHNIDIPKLIAKSLETDGLLPLDRKRSKQSEPLKKLKEFIELSKEAIKDIESKINECFLELTDFDGVLKNKKILINFAEFDKLRDVIKTMTSITLHDGNNHSIESKGSGAQRAVFLSLMKYIAKNIKNSNIIWGIDEPEAFLQPKLQKKVFNSFINMCSENSQQIIITTHSQHFINLNKMESVNLFQGKSTLKEYARKPGKQFHEISTENIEFKSHAEKILTIKEHLGIVNNDGWLLLPFNVIVEGEADKKYIEFALQALNLPIPNILYTGGASKVGGVMQYYNEYAKDSGFENKPKVIGVYDNDSAGRDESGRIKSKKLKHLDIEIITITRSDGKEMEEDGYDWEIEDFLPPDLLIDCANNLLKVEGYKIISARQKDSRYSAAYEKMSILNYLSECSRQNNPDREFMDFNETKWKRKLCQMFCENTSLEQFKKQLRAAQINFLNKLVDKN